MNVSPDSEMMRGIFIYKKKVEISMMPEQRRQMEVEVKLLDLLGLIFTLLSPTLWNRWVGQNKFAFLF